MPGLPLSLYEREEIAVALIEDPGVKSEMCSSAAGRGASTDRSVELLTAEVLPGLRRETAPERAQPV